MHSVYDVISVLQKSHMLSIYIYSILHDLFTCLLLPLVVAAAAIWCCCLLAAAKPNYAIVIDIAPFNNLENPNDFSITCHISIVEMIDSDSERSNMFTLMIQSFTGDYI